MQTHGNLNRAMETETISKNGTSLKSKMSRVIAIIGIAVLSSCGTYSYSYTSAQTIPSLVAQTPQVVTPSPIVGTNVPGTSLIEKLTWLQRNADSHNTYIVEVNANENIAPHTLEYKGAINITVVLRGDSINRTIRLSSHGSMFTVNSNVTFILDNNITLHGHNQNTDAMVRVHGGNFKMNDGSTITGNSNSGVYVDSRGTGTFEMTGGTISGNTASQGGGVNVWGTFTMTGGIISGNTASQYGGGVSAGNTATFTMTGGTISGNSANTGGGVFARGFFTMRGGIITSNTASEYGGGVYGSLIAKTGGTITGYKNDENEGNVVRDIEGVLSRRGHAGFCELKKWRRETTAGPRVNLSYNDSANWEQ
ncbi:MAG: hypothetical protein FWC39_09635 [Bacteroidetes bacterium]|nr:hypothetical protein [Bacteroidota bacterium]